MANNQDVPNDRRVFRRKRRRKRIYENVERPCSGKLR